MAGEGRVSGEKIQVVGLHERAVHEAEHLPPLRIDAEHPRRTVEASLIQVPQQRMHRRRPRTCPTANRIAYAAHLARHVAASEDLPAAGLKSTTTRVLCAV